MSKTSEFRFGGDESPLEQIVAIVRVRGRLKLPPGSREMLGPHALALMTQPGRLQLLPWEPVGPGLEKDFEDARSAEVDAIEDLLDIAVRHDRLNVDADGRIGLNAMMTFHLDIEMGTRQRPSPVRARTVLIWKMPGSVEVWSRSYRNRRLRTPM